jgi:transcriptional regulator with XRE-family HTH domain
MATKATNKAAGPKRSVPRSPAGPHLAKLRGDYGLSRRLLARMLGVSEATLKTWEQGKGTLGSSEAAKLQRVGSILATAAGSLRADYLATWLETPSDACAELGALTPLGLMAKGDYEAVEDLLYYLGSGAST